MAVRDSNDYFIPMQEVYIEKSPSVNRCGDVCYWFTCKDFKEKAKKYESLHIIITMNFGDEPLNGESVNKQEFILKRQSAHYFWFTAP